MDKKQKILKSLKLFGNILVGLSVLFIVYRLYKMNLNLEHFQNPYRTGLLVFLLSFLIIFNYLINAIAWKKYIDFFSGIENDMFALVCVYLKANIQKYLPGNVIQYAGRNLLAKEHGISQKSIAAASVMEVIWISASAVFFSIAISLQNTGTVIRQLWSELEVKENIKMLFLLGIVIFFIGLTALGRSKYKGIIYSYLNKKFLVLLVTTGLIYILNFIVSGILLSLIFALLLHCKTSYISIASTNVLAWLAGYIVPGSPGGIGIREAVLVLLLGSEYSKETVTLAAVLLRVCGIIGDIFSYIMVLGLELFASKRKSGYVS